MESNATTELMELVLRNAGGVYLSDLHDAGNAGGVRRAVLSIALTDYPDSAWAALSNYIIRDKRSFENAGQAVDALIAYLQSIS